MSVDYLTINDDQNYKKLRVYHKNIKTALKDFPLLFNNNLKQHEINTKNNRCTQSVLPMPGSTL